MMTKKELRLSLRESLAEVSSENWRAISQSFISSLVEWLHIERDIKKVGIYSSLPNEVDFQMIHLLLPSVEWHYPLVKGSELSFHRVSKKDTLIAGYFGIEEPDPMVHPPVISSSLDLILCPGLAFTKEGKRLGRGGGFYDRFLATVPNAVKMGVCVDAQLINELPVEEHDVKMTHLLTTNGVLHIKEHDKIT